MSEGTWVWVALAAAVVLDLLIAASRSALGNSRQPELERREAAGVSGAGLAGRVAADATRWMSSLQAGQGLVHLLALALGVRGVLQLTHPAARTRTSTSPSPISGSGTSRSSSTSAEPNLSCTMPLTARLPRWPDHHLR